MRTDPCMEKTLCEGSQALLIAPNRILKPIEFRWHASISWLYLLRASVFCDYGGALHGDMYSLHPKINAHLALRRVNQSEI
jgi:hypothetical protein